MSISLTYKNFTLLLPLSSTIWGTKGSSIAILCNHGDTGAKCRGNIWPTQFLTCKLSREAVLTETVINVVLGFVSIPAVIFFSGYYIRRYIASTILIKQMLEVIAGQKVRLGLFLCLYYYIIALLTLFTISSSIS